MDGDNVIACTSTVWLWRPVKPSAASWYFARIDAQTAAEIKYATLGLSRGFGSVKVTAQIGNTRWNTSLFPNKETGGFLLPLKASVRLAEGLAVDDELKIRLTV
ncbi:MAG: hypothetical protein RIS52_1344 [Pseudomonadota bacterium]|jgi:Domain of unknown function (DUF1905)